jgi:hypothetical protein
MGKKHTMKNPQKKALAYLRTSSSANCGTDKHSEASPTPGAAFAKQAGYEIVGAPRARD